jgi:hypothetical protein
MPPLSLAVTKRSRRHADAGRRFTQSDGFLRSTAGDSCETKALDISRGDVGSGAEATRRSRGQEPLPEHPSDNRGAPMFHVNRARASRSARAPAVPVPVRDGSGGDHGDDSGDELDELDDGWADGVLLRTLPTHSPGRDRSHPRRPASRTTSGPGNRACRSGHGCPGIGPDGSRPEVPSSGKLLRSCCRRMI